jgi:6-phosphogluconolactonase (cycloisomerase 2 family)
MEKNAARIFRSYPLIDNLQETEVKRSHGETQYFPLVNQMKIYPRSVFRFLFSKSTAALSRACAEFRRLQAWSLVILLFGFLAMPLHGQYVYVVNNVFASISGYSIGPGGALIAGPNNPYGIFFPSSVTVDRTSHFVIVSTNPDNLVWSGRIGPGGALTDPKVYSDPYFYFTPTCVTASPNRDLVYATSLDDTLRTFSIGSDGQLTPFGSPLATGLYPTCVAVAPKGDVAYVTNEHDNTVSGYKILDNGVPTEASGSPFSIEEGSPVAVAVTSRFLFVLSGKTWLESGQGGKGAVSVYLRGSHGALTAAAGSPYPLLSEGYAMALDPKKQFLYATSAGYISGFRIHSDGTLTAVPGSPLPAAKLPFGIAVDPSGSFVYTPNYDANNVSGYTIAKHGSLTMMPTSPFAAGQQPIAIAITNSNKR